MRIRIAAFIVVAVTAPLRAADVPTQEQLHFFEKKIRPVLIEQCYKCHAADAEKIRGGLTLDTRDGLRLGGDGGAAIVPGQAAKSVLIDVLRTKDEDRQMPPKKRLPEAVIADFETWVNMGAPDPRDGPAKGAKVEIDIEKGRQFWAYQTPKVTPLPTVRDAAWPKADLDRYVLAALEAKQLKPVKVADATTLVRRVYLDLIGLPPTPEQTSAYANDKSPQALETLVDSLLASPHYGERWGRHWLDVARYAESSGKTVNFNFPHAWRYRDYVIAAFNSDVPFDRFAREQLAGDLLPAKDDAAKARQTIATGFLAIGTKSLNERNRLQYEMDVVDEQIDAFSLAFLGTTAACARCHDHKFDPIPMKDYYALAGIFRSTETCYGTVRFVQANHPSPLMSLPVGSAPNVLEPLGKDDRASIEKQIADVQETMRKQTDPIRNVFSFATIAISRAKLDQYEKDGTPKVLAMGTRERFRANDSPIYIRGEVQKPGAIVPRGVLQVVNAKAPSVQKGSGRLELAEWVASADNPLTARVYVNRVWLHLFGRGLVNTPDNFGTTGAAPSHPELLDYLAIRFMKDGWSTKKLVKAIVLSQTYQLASNYDAKNHEADPDNVFHWRMSPARLDAEVIRDSILAVSGKLTVLPPVGSAVAKAGEGPSLRPGLGMNLRVDPNDTHRSVYLMVIRDNLPEALSLFDAADSSVVVGERANTNVPGQALFLMNNPFVIRQSEITAEKLLAAAKNDRDTVDRSYRLFFGRAPTEEELTIAESFLSKYKVGKKSKKDAWAAYCQAMFCSAEFLMKR